MAESIRVESVWDYPRPPRLEPTDRLVRVELGGRVVAETRRALRILETSHPPNYYIPLEDIDASLLEPSGGRTSFCEWKGDATYFDVVVGRPPRRARRLDIPRAGRALRGAARPCRVLCRADGPLHGRRRSRSAGGAALLRWLGDERRARRKRRLADSNCCKRLCRPLPNHSAKAPESAMVPAYGREHPSRNAVIRVKSRLGSAASRPCGPSSSKIEELAVDALLREHGVDVLRLADRHARVVAAVLDEERRADRVDVRHRRCLEEKRVVLGEGPVLALAGSATISDVFSRKVTRLEMPTPRGRPPSAPLERERGENHVAAVRTAVHHRARCVDRGSRREPVVERGEIVHGVQPQLDVVEVLVSLAVARRPAHVGRSDGVAARDEVLRQRREARREPRPPLRLRARRAR